MFIEDNEWSDDQDPKSETKPVLTKAVKTNGKITFKSKGVGKKSLLRTLQTLGSAQDHVQDQVQEDSDGDSEAESKPARPKRKKKRNRGRKKTDEAGAETAGLQDDKKAENVPKQPEQKDSKTGSLKLKKTDSGNGKSKVMQGKKEENELNRKQWKNKMKNRRKCKNKYREKELETRKADTAMESNTGEQHKVDTGSSSSSSSSTGPSVKTAPQNKAKQAEPKPRKRKLTEPAESRPSAANAQTLEPNQRPAKNTTVKQNPCAKKEAAGSPGLKPTQTKAGGPPAEVKKEKQKEEEEEEHMTPSSKRQKMQKLQEETRRRERLRKMLSSQPDEPERPTEDEEVEEEEEEEAEASEPLDGSSSLRSRMEQRLEAARFRYINEILYTSSSGEAKRMFSQDPLAFGIYHKGFSAQVRHWPANPVDAIIAYIQKKPSSLVVADFGCGDCKIALSVKNKVHSFDLAPICDLVTVCDMAKVPLKASSVHIAVFCLSLMGTNLIDFLAEANRVLVMGGVLKIAEVASRFEDLRGFLSTLSSLGFKLSLKDTKNSHFYSFEFLKTKDVSDSMKSLRLELRPCVYKKR